MAASKAPERVELLQGTLELLVLRTLLLGPVHGHGIATAIQRNSEDLLLIDHGSLYPTLHRLQRNDWLASRWEDTPKKLPMKFYRLTAAGRPQLAVERSNWGQVCRAIS